MTNDQTVTQALEPCPFCGAGDVNPNGVCSYSKGHEAWWADGTEIRESFFVSCVKCGISNRGMFGHRTRELAIIAWNTRTTHSGEGRSNGAGEDAVRSALQSALEAIGQDTLPIVRRAARIKIKAAIAALSAPQGEVERLRAAMKQAEIHIDCASFRKAQDILRAALAQPEAGGAHE